eukprot:jgi/Mesvir1/18354/Mv14250-RA.1
MLRNARCEMGASSSVAVTLDMSEEDARIAEVERMLRNVQAERESYERVMVQELNWKLISVCDDPADDVDLVKWLVDMGAGLQCMDGGNNTPLHLAARRGHRDIVSFLVESGAQLEAYNSRKYTPLRWAVQTPKNTVEPYLDIIQYLIDKGADTETKDKDFRCHPTILNETFPSFPFNNPPAGLAPLFLRANV